MKKCTLFIRNHLPETLLEKCDDLMESLNSPPMPKISSNSSSISNPLLISMVGIVGTSLAIVLYHMLLVKYCARRHGSSADPPRSTTSGGAAAGVDEKVLTKIPIVTFSALGGDGGADSRDECVVCLGEIEDGDEVRLLPGCEHVFHVTCIDRWFAAHASCPVCRSPVVEPVDVDLSVDLGGECSSNRGGGGEEASAAAAVSLHRAQSDGLLRHCASMVVRPPAAERRSSAPRLKRSLSMDQVFVAIGVRCSGDILARSGLCSTRSNLRHLDRVSSKLRRSFSRVRVGMAGGGAILPY